MQLSHRTWFPFILVGLTLVLALGVYAFITHKNASVEERVLTQEEYHQEVTSLLGDYSQGAKSAESVYNTLLSLHIPESEKDIHLDLVLLFGKVLSGELDPAEGDIATMQSTYDWLENSNQ